MRILGNEGEFLSEQEINEAKNSYASESSESDSFLEFFIVGKRFVKSLLSVDGSKGLRIDIGIRTNEETGKQQLYPILRSVTKFGNILPYPESLEIDPKSETELEGMQLRDDPSKDPIKCPTSCN